MTANQLVFTSHYVDIGTTTFAPGSSDGVTNNTSQVTIIGSPAVGLTRQTKYVSLYNADASSAIITIILNNGTDRVIYKATLQSGYTLTYNIETGWLITDTNGILQSGMQGPTGPPGPFDPLFLTNN